MYAIWYTQGIIVTTTATAANITTAMTVSASAAVSRGEGWEGCEVDACTRYVGILYQHPSWVCECECKQSERVGV